MKQLVDVYDTRALWNYYRMNLRNHEMSLASGGYLNTILIDRSVFQALMPEYCQMNKVLQRLEWNPFSVQLSGEGKSGFVIVVFIIRYHIRRFYRSTILKNTKVRHRLYFEPRLPPR